MKFSYNWLKEFVNFELTPNELSDLLLSLGFEVTEIIKYEELKDIKSGKILEINEIKPSRLFSCVIYDGKSNYRIVTNLDYLNKGDIVTFAPAGASLPNGTKISTKEFNDIISEGMLCSEKILGLGEDEKVLYLSSISSNLGEYLRLNDFILNVTIPSNRHDCLGHIGLAREIFVKLDIEEFNLPDFKISNAGLKGFPVEIQDYNACLRYIAKILTSVNFKPSDRYYTMRKRLEYCGIRPVNPLVDITNYTMLEIGHPLHVFDLKKINEKIIVRNAQNEELIETFDNKTYKLNNAVLTISDTKRVLAIGGVIGGINSGVDENTSEVLIESAVFDPVIIRKTSKSLKIITESSYRFERGSNFLFCEMASNRATNLFIELCSAKLISYADVYKIPQVCSNIGFRWSDINSFLGTNYEEKKMEKILVKIGMKLNYKGEFIEAEIPIYRSDISSTSDIAEEVARFIGYDTIPVSTRIPSMCMLNEKIINEQKIKDYLLRMGIYETINYGLLPETTEMDKNTIRILNPVSNEFCVLRFSMLHDLLKVYNYNLSNGIKDIRIFEIGKIFYKHAEIRNEEKALGILCAGYESDIHWFKKPKKIDMIYFSSLIKGLLHEVGKNDYRIQSSTDEIFKFGFNIGSNEIEIGKFGLLKMKDDVYFAELYLDRIFKQICEFRKFYTEIPKFPMVKRDLSIVLDETIPYNEVERIIKEQTTNYICNPILYDIYRSEKLGNGKKSLTFHIDITSPEHTPTDEEINRLMDNIVRRLNTELGAELRKRYEQ